MVVKQRLESGYVPIVRLRMVIVARIVKFAGYLYDTGALWLIFEKMEMDQ